MILCVFNFGYQDENAGSAVANLVPYTAYFKSSRELTNWFRNQMNDIHEIAIDGSFPKNSMCLFMKVIIDYGEAYYEREFTVRCKRIREYNTIIRNSQKKPQ